MGSDDSVQHDKLQTAAYTTSGEHWSSEWATDRDSTYEFGGQGDSDLASFLSRPVKIAEYSWAVGGSLGVTFNPWSAFFSNVAVLKRIANFELLRCDLNVRILVNGTPFHYGMALASYLPLAIYDQFNLDTPGQTYDLVTKSQRLKLFVNPTKSQGGDLLLPYFWLKNWMSVSLQEWNQMGDLNLKTFTPLKHANGGTTPVNITILAWASNVQMSVPTTYVAQSGEYDEGIVSKPASAISEIAKSIPADSPIKPFAKATDMVATSVGKVARLFGFSRPPIISNISLYRPRLFGSLANTDSDEAVHKLTLDSKQELSVDPRVTGLSSHDEMDIKSIATRESYLVTFPWAVSDAAGTQLFATRVTPMMYRKDGVATYQTPSCFVAAPFKYWRGSYKIRFQIVASQYHKGRLLVAYDPNSLLPGVDVFNTTYVRILDLSETNDFTIVVPWTQSIAFRDISTPHSLPEQFEFGTSIGVQRTNNNGVLQVSVLNDLVTPESVVNNDITINVFTSMCDDFEVAAPDSENLYTQTYFNPNFVPQSGEFFEAQSGQVEAKTEVVAEIGEGEVPVVDSTYLVHFGERILSIRTLLKRYCLHSGHSSDSIATHDMRMAVVNRNSFPNYRGQDPNGIDNAFPALKYNYSNTTYLNYFTPAFVARRGSIRYKHTYDCTSSAAATGRLMVSRAPRTSTYGVAEYQLSLNGRSNSFNHRDLTYPSSGITGSALTSNNLVGCLETDIPYYSPTRFSFARHKDINNASSVDYTNRAFISEQFPRSSEGVNSISRYVAAGEDFNLCLFIGVPVIYYDTDPVPI